jgi:Predicted nucleotidyltransferase
MEIIGIICEYNPFHNGHLYHIEKVKELYPNSTIVLVMSGNVTERGELSILSKWDKTDIALNFGIDLVLELPYIYASQAADIFCYGAIKILSEIGVNNIVFGSESNDVEQLKKCAEIQLYDKKYEEYVKTYLSEGLNYPTSLSKALEQISNIKINMPNDLLGLGYVKEIIKNKYPITPISIKRTNDYHSDNIDNSISSATSIRKAILEGIEINNTIPAYVIPFLNKKQIFLNDYFDFIKYKVLSEEYLNKYQTVDNDIIPKMKDNVINSNSLEDFISKIKTKHYTYNKLMRMCSHILFSLTKDEANLYMTKPYIRILGFSDKGKKYLNKRKKEINIPIISNYSNDKDKLLELELRVSKLLSLNKGIVFYEDEYKTKPLTKKDV